jgi:hypothetical protein
MPMHYNVEMRRPPKKTKDEYEDLRATISNCSEVYVVLSFSSKLETLQRLNASSV